MLSALDCFGTKAEETKMLMSDVALSRRTVARRIEQMSAQSFDSLKSNLDSCLFFSAALDESTDVADMSQLLIFVRFIDSDFKISEELLKCVTMKSTTRGLDIFEAFMTTIQDFVAIEKLVSVCTDGAPAMKSTGVGFVGQIKRLDPKIQSFHCIIHQEALCAKKKSS